jgi:hypothetical protein
MTERTVARSDRTSLAHNVWSRIPSNCGRAASVVAWCSAYVHTAVLPAPLIDVEVRPDSLQCRFNTINPFGEFVANQRLLSTGSNVMLNEVAIEAADFGLPSAQQCGGLGKVLVGFGGMHVRTGSVLSPKNMMTNGFHNGECVPGAGRPRTVARSNGSSRSTIVRGRERSARSSQSSHQQDRPTDAVADEPTSSRPTCVADSLAACPRFTPATRTSSQRRATRSRPNAYPSTQSVDGCRWQFPETNVCLAPSDTPKDGAPRRERRETC